MYPGKILIPLTKVILMQKTDKDTILKIGVVNLSFRLLHDFLLLFIDKRDQVSSKNKKLYNLIIKKGLISINDIPHQLFYSRYTSSRHLP